MLEIKVEGQNVVVKSGSSFEVVLENRLFSGRDTYSLSIIFPLDVAQNRDVFGQMGRLDVPHGSRVLECEIRDGNIVLWGGLKIVGGSDKEVKCQFVEGRCEDTCRDQWADTYVNALDLGCRDVSAREGITPTTAWQDIAHGAEAVALPWINESYPGQFNNWARRHGTGWIWTGINEVGERPGEGGGRPSVVNGEGDASTLRPSRLSWMPYLIVICKRICEAVGFSYDFSEWESSPKRFLIICNVLPSAWQPKYADALPRWTVSEWFQRLEPVIGGEFDFEYRQKKVTFRFSKSAVESAGVVGLDSVADGFEWEAGGEGDKCNYIRSRRLVFGGCDSGASVFYSADWWKPTRVRRYPNLATLVAANKPHKISDGYDREWTVYGEQGSINVGATSPSKPQPDVFVNDDVNEALYAEQEGLMMVWTSVGTIDYGSDSRKPRRWGQVYRLMTVNTLASDVEENDDVETEEIDFVPARVEDTFISADDDLGRMIWLSPGGDLGESDTQDDEGSETEAHIIQPPQTREIMAGEKDGYNAYYDRVYLGFWRQDFANNGAFPLVDGVVVSDDWRGIAYTGYSLQISGEKGWLKNLPGVNEKERVTVNFVWKGGALPSHRSVWVFWGRRWICESITLSINEYGISQLVKGVFWAQK